MTAENLSKLQARETVPETALNPSTSLAALAAADEESDPAQKKVCHAARHPHKRPNHPPLSCKSSAIQGLDRVIRHGLLRLTPPVYAPPSITPGDLHHHVTSPNSALKERPQQEGGQGGCNAVPRVCKGSRHCTHPRRPPTGGAPPACRQGTPHQFTTFSRTPLAPPCSTILQPHIHNPAHQGHTDRWPSPCHGAKC